MIDPRIDDSTMCAMWEPPSATQTSGLFALPVVAALVCYIGLHGLGDRRSLSPEDGQRSRR